MFSKESFVGSLVNSFGYLAIIFLAHVNAPFAGIFHVWNDIKNFASILFFVQCKKMEFKRSFVVLEVKGRWDKRSETEGLWLSAVLFIVSCIHPSTCPCVSSVVSGSFDLARWGGENYITAFSFLAITFTAAKRKNYIASTSRQFVAIAKLQTKQLVVCTLCRPNQAFSNQFICKASLYDFGL